MARRHGSLACGLMSAVFRGVGNFFFFLFFSFFCFFAFVSAARRLSCTSSILCIKKRGESGRAEEIVEACRRVLYIHMYSNMCCTFITRNEKSLVRR